MNYRYYFLDFTLRNYNHHVYMRHLQSVGAVNTYYLYIGRSYSGKRKWISNIVLASYQSNTCVGEQKLP